jgi:hypothetical protein
MRGGYSKTFNGAFAFLLLTCIIIILSAQVLVQVAGAHADFAVWSNRSIRPGAPCGSCIEGTCTECIVAWPGVKGVGNLGIGDGNISLMDPAFINDAMKSFEETMAKNVSAEENKTGEVIAAPQNNSRGNSTLISREVAADINESAPEGNGTGDVETEQEETETLTELLLPEYLMAAGVITRAEPYSITINRPFPHILNEDPVEAGVIYGKMFGLPLPDGRMIDIGIKSLGSEY